MSSQVKTARKMCSFINLIKILICKFLVYSWSIGYINFNFISCCCYQIVNAYIYFLAFKVKKRIYN